MVGYSKIVGVVIGQLLGRATLPYDYEIDTAWAISTEDNAVITYQTIWQKIYSLIIKIINKIQK
jgi:hypothetical protein